MGSLHSHFIDKTNGEGGHERPSAGRGRRPAPLSRRHQATATRHTVWTTRCRRLVALNAARIRRIFFPCSAALNNSRALGAGRGASERPAPPAAGRARCGRRASHLHRPLPIT